MPKTTKTCASAPHTGRSRAGTYSDNGVRSSETSSGSAALTTPIRVTNCAPPGRCWTMLNSRIRQVAAVASGTAANFFRATCSRTVPNNAPHSATAASLAIATGPFRTPPAWVLRITTGSPNPRWRKRLLDYLHIRSRLTNPHRHLCGSQSSSRGRNIHEIPPDGCPAPSAPRRRATPSRPVPPPAPGAPCRTAPGAGDGTARAGSVR